ncbi:MAG TPA: iron-sulfur cluster assembly scaffold protein [Actinomycetota bacterium]|nr:iron-sulfur cluster assembly scaffold protein [Actinomycetota bacterium]
MAFSARLLNRFYEPAYVGDVDAPSATATAGNPTCGDVVCLEVEVVDGAISTARFHTLGCAVAIAASDAVCELVAGQSPMAAQFLHLDEVVGALDGIPEGRESCASAPLAALRAVLRNLPGGPGELGVRGPVGSGAGGPGDPGAGQIEASRTA